MNLYVISCLIAVAAGGQLPSNNYLPQGQGQGPSGSGFGGSGFDGSGGIGGFSGIGGASGNYGGNGNRRPQQAQEKNAAILKQDQSISENGDYNFGYETENGIRAEETGRGEQAEGGFAYTGDDGRVYTVTYTAGAGGFRPQGAHLPVAPPTPEAILEALRQNAKDEAAGIFDDGQYRADAQGGPGYSRPGQGSSGNRPGQFGSGGNQNGFNPNTGYTY